MFFGKKKRNTWQEIVENEIKRLKAGDMAGLRTVYCVFALGDEEIMRRAAHVIRQELETCSLSQMLALHGRFRSFTSLEWGIDWTALSPARIFHGLEAEDRRYVLILGTFHPNGYFRERCMEELAQETGVLPYLMLRANDWVRPVRDRALDLVHTYMEQCGTEEILSSMPALEKLERSARRSDTQLEELKDWAAGRLERTLRGTDWAAVWPEDFSIRRSWYLISMKMGLLTPEQMDVWLQKEKNSYGRMILIRGLLSHPDCTPAQAERCLYYPSSQVRRKAVEYKYEHLKGSWPGLEELLCDPGRGVREYAAYILERHTNLDIRNFYHERLNEKMTEYAILGLSEYSHRGNVPVLLQGLESPLEKIQRAALTALGRQEDFEDEALLWNYLLDKRAGISKTAFLAIQKRDFYPGAERIYRAYRGTEEEHIRRYLLRLLLRENSWSRLPWLIRLYRGNLPQQEEGLIRAGMGGRFLYGKVPQMQKEEIYRALGENGAALPEGMAEEILYDMKFV